jgi:hypothetical protein
MIVTYLWSRFVASRVRISVGSVKVFRHAIGFRDQIELGKSCISHLRYIISVANSALFSNITQPSIASNLPVGIK